MTGSAPTRERSCGVQHEAYASRQHAQDTTGQHSTTTSSAVVLGLATCPCSNVMSTQPLTSFVHCLSPRQSSLCTTWSPEGKSCASSCGVTNRCFVAKKARLPTRLSGCINIGTSGHRADIETQRQQGQCGVDRDQEDYGSALLVVLAGKHVCVCASIRVYVSKHATQVSIKRQGAQQRDFPLAGVGKRGQEDAWLGGPLAFLQLVPDGYSDCLNHNTCTPLHNHPPAPHLHTAAP